MTTSKLVTAVSAILFASATGFAVAGPPATADAGKQSAASRRGGDRVQPVHLPTGPVGNQPVPERTESSPAASAVPGAPLYPNSQRNSPKGAASNSAGRRRDSAAQDGVDPLDSFQTQRAVSQQQEAEQVRANTANKNEDRAAKGTADAIAGPSAPRGPTRSANGASDSSTIGASGIVPRTQ
jgi:hypothetical protein